jgi:hypothetical protein
MTGQATAAAATPGVGSIPFTIASRPQARFSNTQTVSNFASGGSFAIIQLPATGWVRKVSLFFTATFTTASAAAIVAGDGPWNLISGITLTDATGQPVYQPISGYNLYLVNKYFSTGGVNTNIPRSYANPHQGPEYAFSGSSTTGTAKFRLDLDFEQDYATGYGCIPNLDSNASLQLKVDYGIYTNAFTGTTPSAATLAMRVSTHYWAPVGKTLNGAPADVAPIGAGDYVETRYETQTVSASSENLVSLTNRGGMVKGVLLVSRAAGVRTAITAGSNLGVVLDNQPIYEGVPIEEVQDEWRRAYGYMGADITTSYAPVTAGTSAGLDAGVVPFPFGLLSDYRDSFLNTRAGSLFQFKVTPGASATQLEIVTQLMQVKDMASFYNRAGA